MPASALEMRRHVTVDIDPDRARFRIVVHRFEAHFTAVAGLPHTAKWTTRVDALIAIDPAHTSVNLRGHFMRAREVAGPQATAQAVLGCVRDSQRFFIAAEAQHGHERTEHLLLRDPVSG